MPYVISIVGDRLEKEYFFDKSPIVIGRLQRNDIFIQDNQISRQHAQIVQNGDAFTIEDLNSTNFVYLNRKKVLKAPLSHGDIVNVGGAANLLFLVEPDAELADRVLREITDSQPEFTSEALQLRQTMESLAGELSSGDGQMAPPIQDPEEPSASSSGLTRNVDDFQALYEISYCVNSTLKLDQVLSLLVTKMLAVFSADRGCIMLRPKDRRALSIALARSRGGELASKGDFSLDVANRSIDLGRALIHPEDGRSAGGAVVMCAPLRVKSEVIGVIYCDSTTRADPFHRKDLLLFEALSHQAAIAIDNARLTEDLRKKQQKLEEANEELRDRSTRLQIAKEHLDRKVAELEALNAVSKGMNMVSDRDSVLQLILEKMVDLLKAERGSVLLCNEETDYMDVGAVLGMPKNSKPKEGPKLKIGEGIAGQALKLGSAVIAPEGHRNASFKSLVDRDRNIRSLLCVPLLHNDRRIGVINITNKQGGANFEESDKPLAMTLAKQAAITIESARLYNEAIFDGLTNLNVHRYFQVWLDKEFQRTKRFNAPLSLVMIDIDNFKAVNDNYGHQFGDVILQEVADLVRKSVRSIDLAARYGGEEFAVILPETDEEGARVFAERLRIKIAQAKYCYQETVLPVTVSMGIATFPRHKAENKDQLIRFADRALYYSKATGKNKVSLYSDEMDALAEGEADSNRLEGSDGS